MTIEIFIKAPVEYFLLKYPLFSNKFPRNHQKFIKANLAGLLLQESVKYRQDLAAGANAKLSTHKANHHLLQKKVILCGLFFVIHLTVFSECSEYLSLGVPISILTNINKINWLHVSPASSFRIKKLNQKKIAGDVTFREVKTT